jgi:hypothetical protein
LFSQKEFIEVSRNFVCVRLESYESKEHQDMVRSFLDGRFENTAFCLLAPDGKERLSGTGRSPAMGLRAGGPRGDIDRQKDVVISSMEKVAKKYRTKGDPKDTVIQDFHTFRQALNVASGDQRLLVFAVGKTANVFADPDVIGRYHWDTANTETDAEWDKVIDGVKSKSGIFIIQADTFGQKGKVLAQLPLDTKANAFKAALTKANNQFAEAEQRKIYSDHVANGRRNGIFFEGGVEYGEDRDGDGKIDHRGGPPPRR